MNDQFTLDYYLKTAWQAIVSKYNQLAAPFGITQATGYVLISIKKEGTSVSQLAGLLGVKKTSLSRLLNNLEDLDLIYREVNAADKRSVKVFLTPLGVEKRKVAKNVVKDFNSFLEGHFSQKEWKMLMEFLIRMNQAAQEYQVVPEEELVLSYSE